MRRTKVQPSEKMYKEFEEVFKGRGMNLTEVVKRGAQYLLQCAVEYEVEDFVGRGYYQNDPRLTKDQGRRNGYEGKRVQTGEGNIEIQMPQVREGKKGPFRSEVLDAYLARTETLEQLVNRMYVLGLSTRDVETVFEEVFAGRGISRSVVSQLTGRLEEDFKKWRTRSLCGERFWYVFLDGSFLKYRIESERKEPILAAYGIREDGKKVLLHVGPGNRESKENWKEFLQEMVRRGFLPPLVVTTDGNPGVIAAIEEIWPRSLRQRCQRHRMQNILGKLPENEWQQKIQGEILQAFHHPGGYEEGKNIAQRVVSKYQDRFPAAMACLKEDLEACLQVLKLPMAHRQAVRTTNLLERLFGEKKRRSKVIPHFFQEKAAMKLAWAVLLAASRKWRGVRIDTETYRQLLALREETLPEKKEDFLATGS